ncbi:MAG: hypothetical protein AABW47_00765 [Nanoarchaeota archaeon]
MPTQVLSSKKILYFTATEGNKDNVRYIFMEDGKNVERLIAELIDGHYVLSVKERGCPTFKVFGVEDEKDYLIAHSRLEERAKDLSVDFDSGWI